MAKVSKSLREQKWERIYSEYEASMVDPDNATASRHQIAVAISKKLKIPLSTVRDVISRREADNG